MSEKFPLHPLTSVNQCLNHVYFKSLQTINNFEHTSLPPPRQNFDRSAKNVPMLSTDTVKGEKNMTKGVVVLTTKRPKFLLLSSLFLGSQISGKNEPRLGAHYFSGNSLGRLPQKFRKQMPERGQKQFWPTRHSKLTSESAIHHKID